MKTPIIFDLDVPSDTAQRLCKHPNLRKSWHGMVAEYWCPECGALWDKDYE